MPVSRNGLVLHLSEHHGDCCPGATVTVQTAGLEEYHREITAKGYRFMRPGDGGDRPVRQPPPLQRAG